MGSRWFSRRAVALHLTLAVVVPAFALLFLWQVRRATGGNDLSWAYVFEWPFFTGYAVYLWWKLLHETADARRLDEAGRSASGDPADGDRAGGTGGTEAGGGAGDGPGGGAGEAEEELAAYNRYLAALNASGRRKRW
ncbi:MAG: hypothetical protein ACYCU7_02195 [Acidimicrobiales bacterium]